MDYRNADGSLSQMCGNGIRVLPAGWPRSGSSTATARSRSAPGPAPARAYGEPGGHWSVDMGGVGAAREPGAGGRPASAGHRRRHRQPARGGAWSTTSTEAGPLTEPPGARPAGVPRRRQRRVRRSRSASGTYGCGCTSAGRARPARAGAGRWRRRCSPSSSPAARPAPRRTASTSPAGRCEVHLRARRARGAHRARPRSSPAAR